LATPHKKRLQVAKKLHQVFIVAPFQPGRSAADFAARQRLGFHFQIHFGVDVGGVEGHMAQPGADGVDVHSCPQKMRSGGMPDGVWANSLAL